MFGHELIKTLSRIILGMKKLKYCLEYFFACKVNEKHAMKFLAYRVQILSTKSIVSACVKCKEKVVKVNLKMDLKLIKF